MGWACGQTQLESSIGKFQAPRSKIQRSSKNQPPTLHRWKRDYWDLDLGASLELGCWILELIFRGACHRISHFIIATSLPYSTAMDPTEAELIAAVLRGDAASFEPLVEKYSPRVFATARRYARRESEVDDIVQEVWLKAFQKLSGFRGEAPFEHWLMRLAVR